MKSQLNEEAHKRGFIMRFMEVEAKDIEEYCNHYFKVNEQLLRLNKQLPEAQAPAFITRLRDDLGEEHQLKVPHLMAKYDDTSTASDLGSFFDIRDLNKYLKISGSAMKAVTETRGANCGSGYANSLLAALDSANPKILEHRKNGMLFICKLHPEDMHSWLTCLDNAGQTIGHPARKQRPIENKFGKKMLQGQEIVVKLKGRRLEETSA